MNKKQSLVSWAVIAFSLMPGKSIAQSLLKEQTAKPSMMHLVGRDDPSYDEVDSSRIAKRLEESAQELGRKGIVKRFAMYDVALPADNEEYIGLNKNAIVMISAVTRDKAELPIKKAYIRSASGVVVLEGILSIPMDVVSPQVKSVFGDYQEDYCYLLPFYLTVSNATLVVEWGDNSDPFVLGEFPVEWECSIEDDKPEEQNLQLNEEALKKFLKREFSIVFKSE